MFFWLFFLSILFFCFTNTEWTHFGSVFVPHKYRMKTFWITICAAQIQNEHILGHYLCFTNTKWTHFESLFALHKYRMKTVWVTICSSQIQNEYILRSCFETDNFDRKQLKNVIKKIIFAGVYLIPFFIYCLKSP